MRLILAPMEGLADAAMRDVLTHIGGIDLCVAEFVRVADHLVPAKKFLRTVPELANGGRTPNGTPVRVQLLGHDAACLADNAARAAELGAPGIDLNFGCPSPTVNRHGAGAILLDQPERLRAIVATVRRAVPEGIPVSAKMRLGVDDTGLTLDCARAVEAGGAAELAVHARTRADRFRPPARWEWIARVREAVNLRVIANGDVWLPQDWRRIRTVSGCEDVMLGRGLISRPDLARRIRAGEDTPPMPWRELLPWLIEHFRQARVAMDPRHAPGRLKQWLGMLRAAYPEAEALHRELRLLHDPQLAAERLERDMAINEEE
jgi:tRNA-dihydrouridine synthase C